MARVVKEEKFANRRNEILDAAQMLIYSKGYEQMTIQDILEALRISKGAFYHYFESKQALLEAIIERTTQEGIKVLQPILEDDNLSALEKFHKFFDAAARWKSERKAFFLALLRVWYIDENAIVRQKMQVASLRQLAPLLAEIVQQGIQEGVFHSVYPEKISEVLMALMVSQGDAIAVLLLEDPPGQDLFIRMQQTTAVYEEAMERAVGAPPGSLILMDEQTLREWVDVLQEQVFSGS